MQGKNELSADVRTRHPRGVAQNKTASVGFRTQEALKERFDAAFAKQAEYSTPTAFFEDCMRSLIHHARRGEKLAVPAVFLTKGQDESQTASGS